MNIINNYGIEKKNHTYLYDNFNDSMNQEFRKLKGRFYKKTNHWVFPFLKTKQNITESLQTTTTSKEEEIKSIAIQTNEEEEIEEEEEIKSIAIQTEEEEEIKSTAIQTNEEEIEKEEEEEEENSKSSYTETSSTDVILENISDKIFSTLDLNSCQSELASVQTQTDNDFEEVVYVYKPPEFFYQQISSYL